MKLAERITVALTLVIGIITTLASMSSGQIMVDRTLGEDSIWKGGELESAFSGLGNVVVLPLGVEHIEGGGVGLSFYVGWGDVAPTTYSQVSQAVEQFRGLMNWSIRPEFNNRGAFISALPLEQARKSFHGEHKVQQVSVTDLRYEMEKFCTFVQKTLQNGEPVPGYNQKLGLSAEPFEDSTYRVFLVAHPEQFSGSPTSSFDRLLHFGITEDEWVLLSREASQSLGSVSTLQASFLLKLKQRYEIVRLAPNDVVSLGTELLGSESGMTDARLQGAIQKVRKILLEASENKLGVVFEPND